MQLLPALRAACIAANDTLYWSRAENLTSIAYSYFGQTNFGLKHAERAYELALKIRQPLHQAKALVSMANAYGEKNELLNSQIQLQKAYRIYFGLDSAAQLAEVASSLSLNFRQLGLQDSALFYGKLGIQFAEKVNNPVYREVPYNNMGMLLKESDPEGALYWFRKALAINPGKPAPRFNIANVYTKLGQWQNAIELLDTLLADCVKTGAGPGVARCQWQIAEIHKAQGDLVNAEKGLRLALQTSDSLGIAYVSNGVRNSLVDVYRQQGKPEQALAMAEALTRTTDSIHRREKELAVKMAGRYQEAERLQQSLVKLNKESASDKISNGILVFILLVSLVSLVVAIMVLRWRLRRSRELLQEQLRNYELLVTRMQQSDGKTGDPIFNRLIAFMEEEKPWLNPDLKADDILQRMNCSRKTMTVVLKKEQIPGLIHLAQHYRVKEAMRLIQDPRYRHYKIEAIGKESGFGSYRTFHHVFVQQTGMNPMDYRSRFNEGTEFK